MRLKNCGKTDELFNYSVIHNLIALNLYNIYKGISENISSDHIWNLVGTSVQPI